MTTEYTDSDGVRYIAKASKRNSSGIATCSGCAHKAVRHEDATPGCMDAPQCNGQMHDNAIIWVRADGHEARER